MVEDKTIYAIQHNKTKRLYIGCSIHFEKRIREHICHLRNHNHINTEFQKDFDLYGEDYSFYVLEKNISHYDSFDIEKVWIRILRSNEIERGYNLSRMERPLTIDDFPKVDVVIGKMKSRKEKHGKRSKTNAM